MTMPTAQNPSGRIVFLDDARVAACFLVILVHSAENFYAADASGLAGNMTYLANEANRFWVSFYDGLARVCVPLFMIISSYLLVPLKEGQTMGAFYRKRFLRVVPPMVFFMLLYTFLPLLWGGMTAEQSMQDAIASLEAGMELDIVTIDLENSWTALKEITGKAGKEDLLDEIFSRFCLGK